MIDCNGQTIIQITDILKKQKFLQPTPGYKLKGFSRRGLPKFSITQSDDVRQRMAREILHPMVKIQHHVSITILLRCSREMLMIITVRCRRLSRSRQPGSNLR
jgi:hypothetical protein